MFTWLICFENNFMLPNNTCLNCFNPGIHSNLLQHLAFTFALLLNQFFDYEAPTQLRFIMRKDFIKTIYWTIYKKGQCDMMTVCIHYDSLRVK